jgi:hypothetical protein
VIVEEERRAALARPDSSSKVQGLLQYLRRGPLAPVPTAPAPTSAGEFAVLVLIDAYARALEAKIASTRRRCDALSRAPRLLQWLATRLELPPEQLVDAFLAAQESGVVPSIEDCNRPLADTSGSPRAPDTPACDP